MDFFGMAILLLATLKLTGVISVSWWFVASPALGWVAILVVFLLGVSWLENKR